MNKTILLALVTLILISTNMLTAKSAPSKLRIPPVYIVDDFEDGKIDTDPKWWGFGNIKYKVQANLDREEVLYLGEKSLELKGSTPGWYIGGIGTFLNINGDLFDSIKLVVFGTGYDSGQIVIELYDDDNNNQAVDLHPTIKLPSEDDKFIYTLKVNWTGWRVITIPFKKFFDDNQGIGDDTWNPNVKKKSGGLLQLQLICISTKKKGGLNIQIDSIKLFKSKKRPKKNTKLRKKAGMNINGKYTLARYNKSEIHLYFGV